MWFKTMQCSATVYTPNHTVLSASLGRKADRNSSSSLLGRQIRKALSRRSDVPAPSPTGMGGRIRDVIVLTPRIVVKIESLCSCCKSTYHESCQIGKLGADGDSVTPHRCTWSLWRTSVCLQSSTWVRMILMARVSAAWRSAETSHC